MTAEEYTRKLAAAGKEPVEPPTPEEQDALDLEEAVTEALLSAEQTARSCRETELADCLARLQVIWAIGGVAAALALLDRARDVALDALREHVEPERRP